MYHHYTRNLVKILVTGRGYIGSSLGKCLSTCYETIVISRHEVDYTKRDILKRYIKKNDIGLVINTCGYTGRPNVDACENDKSNTWHYNVRVPVNMQKVCKDLVIPMIHISSGCIYTGYDKEFTEDDEPNFGMFTDDSSWYSKTKHACEMMLQDCPVYTFRIRMPFCDTWSDRNVLTKLLKYDNIIDQKNSMTNVQDLCGYILYFLSDLIDSSLIHPYGIYNVVNPNPVNTSDIVKMLIDHGLENPNWNTITLDQLYENTTAKRSNCVLSDNKIENINLKLPDTLVSLERSIIKMRGTTVDNKDQRLTG